MSQQTQSPWRVSMTGLNVVTVEADADFPNGRLIAATSTDSSLPARQVNARLIAASPALLKYAERALDQLTNDRDEECWCYDGIDGAPDSPPPGPCLACSLRDVIAAAKGGAS